MLVVTRESKKYFSRIFKCDQKSALFFRVLKTIGTSLQGVLHPFKAPKGSKTLNFLKEAVENVMITFEKPRTHAKGIMGTVSSQTFSSVRMILEGLRGSFRGAVKESKNKLQDRPVHLPHCSSRKFTCDGSLQSAVSNFTAVCTESRQYRV